MQLFLDGYNTSVLTFGPKKSGKTYTMYGNSSVMQDCGVLTAQNEKHSGILPRVLDQVIKNFTEQTSQNPNNLSFNFKISFFEMYQDQLNNLISNQEPWQNVNFYDNESKPTGITLCKNTCDMLQASKSSALEIVYGCKTIVK